MLSSGTALQFSQILEDLIAQLSQLCAIQHAGPELSMNPAARSQPMKLKPAVARSILTSAVQDTRLCRVALQHLLTLPSSPSPVQ